MDAWASFWAAFFCACWGLNYSRPTLIVQQGWDEGPAAGPILSGEVAALAARLAGDVRAGWAALPPELADDAGSCLPHDRRALVTILDRGYAALDWLAYAPARSWESPPPKPVYALFYPFGTSGMYSPWTSEVQYDAALPDSALPYTVAHELAHARGFAREDEADLLAWAAATRSGDPYVTYAGSLGAFRWAASTLSRYDPEGAQALWSTLPAGARADVQRTVAYARDKPQLTVALGNVTYDAYLKSQGVADGRLSYGRMVKLLVYASRDPTIEWSPRRE